MVPFWMSQGLCGTFASLPWIAESEARSPAATAAMELVCHLCPVRVECEKYVDSTHVVSGFWAGRDRTPDSVDARRDGAA